MARRRKQDQHANHERWLISYADFITLLFAFFVVMFAVSQVDTNKMGRFAESVRAASRWQLFEDPATAPVSPINERMTHDNERIVSQETQLTGRELVVRIREILQEGIVSGRMSVVEGPEGVIVRLHDAAYFDSGSAVLKTERLADLEAVAKLILEVPNPVRIEGHTDPRPIQNAVYPSNWELSAGRAASMLRYLSSAGVPESRLSIVGYADRRPVASNESDEGRRKNRRVDVVLLRDAGAPSKRPRAPVGEPPSPSTTTADVP
ncbi:MAG TPA: flagellar motor protein MotB [Polyangiaceae bacterium]|nr:flagellar motor protein MotB [Polyangiaceae bacterium]